jgi:hypothetical protein
MAGLDRLETGHGNIARLNYSFERFTLVLDVTFYCLDQVRYQIVPAG